VAKRAAIIAGRCTHAHQLKPAQRELKFLRTRARPRHSRHSPQNPERTDRKQFSLPDQGSRHLFLALCRRCGLRPFRYRHQRRNTVMIRASRGFVDKVLLPEFTELESALRVCLHEVTLRVIREEIYDDTSDAQEVPDALPSNCSSGTCS
jgi:hypothetical protein